ncbi:hypothetical protein FACS1894125_1510 [Actinomycetota bacterium]|nr:hypothetical protein FACS1894125_1510 [Actinomycetota bacterium]
MVTVRQIGPFYLIPGVFYFFLWLIAKPGMFFDLDSASMLVSALHINNAFDGAHSILQTFMLWCSLQITYDLSFWFFVQLALAAFCLGASAHCLYKYGIISKIKAIIMVSFFTFYPTFYSYALGTGRDFMFCVFLLLFLCLLIASISQNGSTFLSPKFSVVFMIVTFMMLGFRKNSLPILIVAFIVCIVIFKLKSVRVGVIKSFAVVILLTLVVNIFGGFVNGVNIGGGGGWSGAFSIPKQQVASVASDKNIVISPVDRFRLSQLNTKWDEYYPLSADSVSYDNGEPGVFDNSSLAPDFFRLWIKFGLQHPIHYIKAFALNESLYFFPLAQDANYDLTIADIEEDNPSEFFRQNFAAKIMKRYFDCYLPDDFDDFEPYVKECYDKHTILYSHNSLTNPNTNRDMSYEEFSKMFHQLFYGNSDSVAPNVINALHHFPHIPPLGAYLFFNTAMPFYLLFVLFTSSFSPRKRKPAGKYFWPIFSIIACYFVSLVLVTPVVGMRYGLPVLYGCCLLFFVDYKRGKTRFNPFKKPPHLQKNNKD